MKPPIYALCFIVFSGIALAGMGQPEDIPNAGHIRIDGRLRDWRNAEWTPLNQILAWNPVNISNAQWSIQWNDDPSLFIAVRYDDADLVLQNGFVNSNAQDCVEIYVRGDNGSEPLDYSTSQISAQHYIFGLATNRVSSWKKLAAIDPFPAHNPTDVAITLDGSTLTYEIRVPLYDEFYANNRRDCETTEVMDGLEIGIDIAIIDVGSTGFAGVRSENILPDKASHADHIALHTLSE